MEYVKAIKFKSLLVKQTSITVGNKTTIYMEKMTKKINKLIYLLNKPFYWSKSRFKKRTLKQSDILLTLTSAANKQAFISNHLNFIVPSALAFQANNQETSKKISKKFDTGYSKPAYSKLSEVKLITIGLASPEKIRQWAEKTLPNGKVIGQVTNANTLHHKTFKPQKGGLFCERIFGPLKDFQCACGTCVPNPQASLVIDTTIQNEKSMTLGEKILLIIKQIFSKTPINTEISTLQAPKAQNARRFCKKCDVEYTWSVIRRYQLGYIQLISPVTHIWYLKGNPSYLSILLDMKKRHIEYVTYCTESLTLENAIKGNRSRLSNIPSKMLSEWGKTVIQPKSNNIYKQNLRALKSERKKQKRLNTKIQKRLLPLAMQTFVNWDLISLTSSSSNLSAESTSKNIDHRSTHMLNSFTLNKFNSTPNKKFFIVLSLIHKTIYESVSILAKDNTRNMHTWIDFHTHSCTQKTSLVLKENSVSKASINQLNKAEFLKMFSLKNFMKKLPTSLYLFLNLQLIFQKKVLISTKKNLWKKIYLTSLKLSFKNFFFLYFCLFWEKKKLVVNKQNFNKTPFATNSIHGIMFKKKNFKLAKLKNKKVDFVDQWSKPYRNKISWQNLFISQHKQISLFIKKVKMEWFYSFLNSVKKIKSKELLVINQRLFTSYDLTNEKAIDSTSQKLVKMSYSKVLPLIGLEQRSKLVAHKATYSLLKQCFNSELIFSQILLRNIIKKVLKKNQNPNRPKGLLELISKEIILDTEKSFENFKNQKLCPWQINLPSFLSLISSLCQFSKTLSHVLFMVLLKEKIYSLKKELMNRNKTRITKKLRDRIRKNLKLKLTKMKNNKVKVQNERYLDQFILMSKKLMSIKKALTPKLIATKFQKQHLTLPRFIKNFNNSEIIIDNAIYKMKTRCHRIKCFYGEYFCKSFKPLQKGIIGSRSGKNQDLNKKFPKLVNNIYSLSHRERWVDEEWQNFIDYMSVTLNKKLIIPKTENQIGTSFNLFNSSNKELTIIPAYKTRILRNSRTELTIARNDTFLNYNNCKTNNAAYSGPGIIQQLLNEFHFIELIKMDKQNRFLLYLLTKQIFVLKKQVFDESVEKELKECYKKRDQLIRRTKLIRTFSRKNSIPNSMILTILPVLPPDLRPIVKIGGQIAASDLNRLYQRVIYRNDRLKKFLKDPSTSSSYEMKYAQRLLQESVDNLIQNGKSGNASEKDARGRALKSLSDLLKGKQGRFRQFLLGKRVDYSGRSVIVVGPKLKLHECGLPKEMALELYLPFLLKRILNHKYARTVVGAKTLIKKDPDLIWELLKEIMQTCPVLLNRAPTLHRLGIQAFQPKLIEGRAILLHPLVCPAFNADFDGDQMAVHVPITVEARAEAWKLMCARQNFLSPATGDPLAIPSQDMVLGCYYLTTHCNKGTIKNQKGSGFSFSDFSDVLNAYRRQIIDLHSLVWVKFDGNLEQGNDQDDPIEIRINSYGHWNEIYQFIQLNYSKNNNLVNQYICTTPGRILFNFIIQNTFFY